MEGKVYANPGSGDWNKAESSNVLKEVSVMEIFLRSQEEAQTEQRKLLGRLESVLHRFKDERNPSDICGSEGEMPQPDHNTRLTNINRQAISSNDWLRSLLDKAEAII